jgi:hypothetical protein
MSTASVVFSAFSSVCLYSLYQLWSSARSSAAPLSAEVPHDDLLDILTHVRAAAEAECAAVAEALALAEGSAADEAGARALREHARARVQAALAAAEAEALAPRRVGAAAAARALAYWEGPGRSAKIADVARDIRVAAGAWLLSQQRALGLYDGFLEARTQALSAAAVLHGESRGSSARRLRDFDLHAASARAESAGALFLVAQGGVTLDQLDAAVREWKKVRSCLSLAHLTVPPPPPPCCTPPSR